MKISVIIPHYRGSAYLKDALEDKTETDLV